MDARAALRDIRHLASDIGPREATSRQFAEAATFVEKRFERLGYDVKVTDGGVAIDSLCLALAADNTTCVTQAPAAATLKVHELITSIDGRAVNLPGDIARREIGGLGLHLARSIASDFHYARDAHGNRVVIRFDPSDEPAT